jgi:hypothetical protein
MVDSSFFFLFAILLHYYTRALLIAISSIVAMRRWRLFSSSPSTTATGYRVKEWVENWSFFLLPRFSVVYPSFMMVIGPIPYCHLPINQKVTEVEWERQKVAACGIESIYYYVTVPTMLLLLVSTIFNACLIMRNDC